MIITCVEMVSGICLNGLALYILVGRRKRTVGDLLLIHLSAIEGIFLVWELIYTSLYIQHSASRLFEVHTTGLVILYTCIYQLMILITVDRILAVKLTLRYKIIVRKRKVLVSFIILHLLSWLIGCMQWIADVSFYNIAGVNSLFWDFLVLAITIGGYVYIITASLCRRRKMNKSSSRIPPLKINYTIPLCIAGSFVCFMVIPDIVLTSNDKLHNSVWFSVVFKLNLICDPLSYIIVSKFKVNKNSISRTSQQKSNITVSYSKKESNCTVASH